MRKIVIKKKVPSHLKKVTDSSNRLSRIVDLTNKWSTTTTTTTTNNNNNLTRRAEEKLDFSTLTDNQKRCVELAEQGSNIFITGSAGTGKSYVLKFIKKALQEKNVTYKLTASTGVAAVNIGGQTLHHALSIGLGEEEIDKLFFKIVNNERKMKKWDEMRCLIIDEISMISGHLWDKLNVLAQRIKKIINNHLVVYN